MDYWEHLTLRLYERCAWKAKVFATVERLRRGVAEGRISTRCQWAGCSNLLRPHLRQRYCCRNHERRASDKRAWAAGKRKPTPWKKKRQKEKAARFQLRMATEFSTHCTSAPCQNVLHHKPRHGQALRFCSLKCAQREQSRRSRARKKVATPSKAPKPPPAPRSIFSRHVPAGLPTHCSATPCCNLLAHHLGKPGERRLYCSALCANQEQERRARTGRLSAR